MTELQLRLRQTGRYGAEADGSFDREVNARGRCQLTRAVSLDESGVSGPATQ